MIKDATTSQARSRSVLSRPLKRGTACMNCRFLKIKCDGARPICGPCSKHPKDDECEYTDGPARLQELERPEENTPSVTLYDPYTTQQLPFAHRSLPGTPYGVALPRLLTPGSSESHLDLFSPPPSTTASTPPFGTHGHGMSPLGIFDSRAVATPDSSVSSGLEFHDARQSDRLIQNFLPHGAQFGFFLDPQRLALMSPQSPASATSFLQRTSPALFYILCAFGAHISAPRDRVTEDRFIFRALQAPASSDYAIPRTLLHTIQAEVLIAYYLWRNGAILQARVHSATAGALVLGAGLHQSRSTVIAIVENPSDFEEQRLPQATDSIDVGERIRAVWAVSALQKMLAVAEDAPIDVCGVFEQVSVEVPWPREVEEYRDRQQPSFASENTMKRYLAGQEQDMDDSVGAMLVKAQVLLHRAVYMQGQWSTAASQQQQQALMTAFHSLMGLVHTLRAQLPSRYPEPSRHSPAGSSHSSGSSTYSQPVAAPSAPTYSPKYAVAAVDERVRLAHALLDVSTFRLHELEVQMAGYMYTYGYDPAQARAAGVRSAMDMLSDAAGFAVVHPIMGTLWHWAITVLGEELKRLRQQQSSQSQTGWSPQHQQYDYDYDKELRVCLQEGLGALQAGARDSVSMRRSLLRAREMIALAGFANEMAMGIGVGAGV
ncbi:hypothetical protein C8F01DRAFT_88862 [Mycena amicta]|nr:hypothetical protein C8F01DRAFT_88862 [Mycena amicta]